MNIVLIGYRGSGKSRVGQLLAQRLGRQFVDTDVLIVERAGQTIREIFAQVGEPGFRDLETAVVNEVAARDNQVIAVGGGAVLRPANVAALKRNGKIVWLQADAETLWQRINADQSTEASRPNLTPGGGLEEVRQLLAVRTPLYQAAADLTLDVTALTPEQAADRIIALL